MANNTQTIESTIIDFPRDKWKNGGSNGGDGGNDMDDLKKRVERTEENIAQIKIDLATLTARSENFASKSTLDALVTRSEAFATKSDVESVRTEIYKAKAELSKEISSISRSIWIPLTVGLVGGLLLWAAKIFLLK
ncbi:TPA: hypothetical protein SMH10_001595 [Klebsiella oxytoca]|uniref:hypothetical protein n=1 Tax=Klebsiella oxytoca TaxID=571 RepID=UPI00064B254B|nr:hypothetical protein [Klebsiella oxytoca]AKL09231.1 hypothetical protein AB184_29940 [Klebsiella oxytoca]AKL26175.1 hypothetical protein AB181_30255 [Klebsiella oxytoca]APB44330.1 hypothetical protein AGF18_10505 [Klebsiella oxytoca]EKU2837476.1 hypothetical protein [Klebsiella oxytoca]EKU7499314.1 hypothetical protein [Klebsiella oxytoca]